MKCVNCNYEFEDCQRCPNCGFLSEPNSHTQNSIIKSNKKHTTVKAWQILLIIFVVLTLFGLALNVFNNLSVPTTLKNNNSNITTINQNINEIFFVFSDDIFMDVNDTKTSVVIIDVKDLGKTYNESNIEIIIEDNNIATVEYDHTIAGNCLYFNITANSYGKTTMYAKSKDDNVTSDKITIIVNEKSVSRASDEIVYEEDEVSKKDNNANNTVYYTLTGKKYHYENPCGKGEYLPISLKEAEQKGLEPCKKCVLH